MSAVELQIKFKGDEWNFSHKFLVYENFEASEEDEHVKACIDQARSFVNLVPEDISFKIVKVVQ